MGCCSLNGKINYINNENISCVNIVSKSFDENQNDHSTTILSGFRTSLKSITPSTLKRADKQKSCFDKISNPLPGIVNIIPRKK